MPPFLAPKDKTRREHLGRVDRVVFASEADDFVILALDDGATVLGPASASAFARGTIYRFLGKWTDDAKFGPRFRFSTFTVHSAHGRIGVVKYLTETCDGVGKKTAEAVFEKFGGDSVETLRTDPAAVAAACGLDLNLCDRAALALEDAKKYEATRIDLFELFDGRGFFGRLIEDCIERWGADAPRKIRRNPFALLGMVSAGFKRCDKLWVDLKLPPTSLKRAGLCAWNLARTDRNGHTWLPAEDLASQLRDTVPGCDVFKSLRFAIRARRLKKHIDAAGKVWLAVYHRATAEERIVRALKRLAGGSSEWPADRVPVSCVEGDKLPTAHQVAALRLATAGPVGLFLGGPGTGKSHSVAYLVKAIREEHGRDAVAVCAPTGKAANRATQALAAAGIGITARTIHSTLGIGRNGHDGDGWEFDYGPTNPLPVKFVVVDEPSMIDTDLMADLLDAVATGGQVLLVGDPGQLPPVGHGAPLRDLLAAGLPCGTMTEVRRNAGAVVEACAKVRAGERFEVCPTIDLEAESPRNLKLVEARDEAHASDIVAEVVRRLTRFDPVRETQVVVARNKGTAVGRKELNARLHPMLNPDGYGLKDQSFRVGDKVICTRNTWMPKVEPVGEFRVPEPEAGVLCGECGQPADPGGRCWVCGSEARVTRDVAKVVNPAWDAGYYQAVMLAGEDGFPSREPDELYVANGEIGRVVAIAQKFLVARFSEGSHLVKVLTGKGGGDDEDDGGGGCHLEHAYAVTCHRLQGSEAPCVIVVGDDRAGGIATREWIYTAISRASKLCILVGQMSTFQKMVGRVALTRRKTFLAEMVRAVLSPAPVPVGQLLNQ